MHLRPVSHRATPAPDQRGPAATTPAGNAGPAAARVLAVHRVGALGVAAVILVFGLLGFAGGLEFFSTSGEPILGMSSNGLLSTISVITAAVLVFAALRGPRVASTIMMIVGSLFILSALANLAVLRTDLNLLAFEMSNVVFSAVAGLVLLLLGAYGRLTGNLPPDSPYAAARPQPAPEPPEYPSTPAEFAAERAMREAELAVVNHVATAEQRRRVAAMARVHSRYDRRRVWMEFDAPRS
ncbi:DUF4383 domain-containing protein [Blastococcus deserti]|uniref:DUF4383 domain-containing protein n=1 Tax=Blastococcus deserti TaxID=2259033 RepID=A0ABW4XA40_9ACTN